MKYWADKLVIRVELIRVELSWVVLSEWESGDWPSLVNRAIGSQYSWEPDPRTPCTSDSVDTVVLVFQRQGKYLYICDEPFLQRVFGMPEIPTGVRPTRERMLFTLSVVLLKFNAVGVRPAQWDQSAVANLLTNWLYRSCIKNHCRSLSISFGHCRVHPLHFTRI